MPVIARTAALAAETLPKLLLDSVRSAAASMPTATLLLDRVRSAAASVPKLRLDRVHAFTRNLIVPFVAR